MRLLTPVLVASDGHEVVVPPTGLETGVLLRDLDLMALVAAAGTASTTLAVDLDSVEGLNADVAAARFLAVELGVDVVITRRPAVASRVAALGRTALLHVFAFDSTGLARSLEGHPREPGIGTVLSPGPVLDHLPPAEVERLPRPLVAYGFVETAGQAWALLRCADSVVVRPGCALEMARSPGSLPLPPLPGRYALDKRGRGD
jgi:glycerol-3-phosphate responsive antiterminator